MDWIISNKEWIFSGVGIFVIASICSLLSAMIVFIAKGRGEKKKRNRLHLKQTLVKFELPNAEGDLDTNALSVSYQGTQYKHLCYYALSLENIGLTSVEGQKLLLSYPSDTSVLKISERPSNASINISPLPLNSPDGALYVIDRLEPGEGVTITILANAEDAESISCTPRGVDNAEYALDKSEHTSDVELLALLVAMLLAVGAIPFLGGLMQALLIMASLPTVLRLIKRYFSHRKQVGAMLIINGGINTSDEATVNISHLNERLKTDL